MFEVGRMEVEVVVGFRTLQIKSRCVCAFRGALTLAGTEINSAFNRVCFTRCAGALVSDNK